MKRVFFCMPGYINIVSVRTLQYGEKPGRSRRLLLDYFKVFKKGSCSVTWMVSCREAVPQAPSLGRFDVLLLSFEVEKCRLCLLFVGEKYGEIDKKLICVCVCVFVAQIKTEYLSDGASSSREKWNVFFSQSPPPLPLLLYLLQILTPLAMYIGAEPACSEVSR